MATYTLFTGSRYTFDTTYLAQFYGSQSATLFEVIGENGVLREANHGRNFTYRSNGFFNTGTVNERYTFTSDGRLSGQATGLNVDVATRNSLLSVGTSGYEYFQYELRGNDTIRGSEEDDRLVGSHGRDRIDGRNGSDVLTFDGFDEGVLVNLATGRYRTSDGTSIVTGVEDVEGSDFADTLIGDGGKNQFQGFGGNDAINGGAGIDTAVYFDAAAAIIVNLATRAVTGGSGSDTLSLIERVLGSRFDDMLTGSNANEFFLGGFGDDTLDGGGGIDTVEYGLVGSGVTVNLATGKASGGAGNDLITAVENVIGSLFNDRLTGSSRANRLDGRDGADILDGGAGGDLLIGGEGNDRLNGGLGNDRLMGGAGADSFLFTTPLSGNGDRILDFSAPQDTIRLDNAIFDALPVGALAPGAFRIGAGAGAAGDRIIYDSATGILLYDADGTGPTAAIRFATLSTGLALENRDFVII